MNFTFIFSTQRADFRWKPLFKCDRWEIDKDPGNVFYLNIAWLFIYLIVDNEKAT